MLPLSEKCKLPMPLHQEAKSTNSGTNIMVQFMILEKPQLHKVFLTLFLHTKINVITWTRIDTAQTQAMVHSVMSWYFSFSFFPFPTMLAHPCIHVCSCLLIWNISTLPKGWPYYHGPTNIRAIVKKKICAEARTGGGKQVYVVVHTTTPSRL